MAKAKLNLWKSIPRRQQRIILFVVLGVLGLLVVGGVCLATFAVQYKDKIYPNTFVGDVNLGGKSQTEAAQLLKQKISQLPDKLEVIMTDDSVASINRDDIDLQYDVDKTVQDVYAIGRNRQLGNRLRELFLSFTATNNRTAAYSVNDQTLTDKIEKVTSEVGTKATDAQIILNEDGTLSVSPAKEGKGITKEALKHAIDSNLAIIDLKIEILSSTIKPKVTEDQTGVAVEQVRTILAHAPLTLKAGDVTATADQKKVFSWVVFELKPSEEVTPTPTPSVSPLPDKTTWLIYHVKANDTEVLVANLDTEKVKNFVNNMATNVNHDPTNAQLRVTDGKVTVVTNHSDGQKLKVDDAIPQVITALTTSDDQKGLTISLPVDKIAAEVRADNIESLGIKELIGHGETSFTGSPSNRVHNITTGAGFLTGKLVPKGQDFSTVKTLGAVDGSTGYLPELVIKENRTTPEFGGGLCQVSTTLFRSVLNAGLKVTQRTNHSYRVSYYEPPVGLDATIYLPGPDFRFLNDTPGYILIQSKVEGTKITFDLYGTKDGRTSAISDPVVTNVTDPPAPLYSDTDTLPKGTTKQIERAHQGATAVAIYTVTRDGKEINKQTFRSVYKPWQAQFLVGTKEQ
jgi:vancomycin resistance protein YoaR